MSINGDVSEQVIRLSLEGFEVLAKLTGSGAKNIAAMIYAIMKDQKQTKGKTRLNNMLKTGKPLKIFSVKNEDLKKFSQEAKKYGILYCALVDKKNKDTDGMIDIMVKEEDASRINRIVERFKITTVDTAKMITENSVNFNLAKTEKSPLSEHSSTISKMQDGVTKSGKKPSIRKELAKMKMEVQKKYKQKANDKILNSKVINKQER